MTTLFSKVRNRALCWLERRGPRIEDVCIGTMRYGSITGTAVEDGFRIDPDELLHLLDRVETALDSR
jgi:hypothetical protein